MESNQNSESLKTKTKKGLYWSAASNFANQGMRFVFGLILARLLSPDAYGVIGMLGVFMCVIQVFIDCGFSQALIAKQDRTQTDFSTEFFFNIGVGIVGYIILFVAAPFIADFYNMEILSPVLRVLGIGIVINSFCVVQNAQFGIRLDFKTPAKLGVSTNLFSGIVGIALAYFGWGVWALVFQQVASDILNAILVWVLAGWRPTLEFSRDSFKYLWNYGSKILASSIIQQVYDNLYPLVIGKFFSARQLGLYSRAQGFASLPSTNLSGILASVTFPVLSKINNDIERLVAIYRKMMKTTAFIVFPLMVGLCATASPLIKILLNEQWYECILLCQLLCCALIWQPLSLIHLSVLKVAGRTDLVLKLEIMKRSMGLISIFGAIPFGVVGMCVGFNIFYIYCFSLNTYFTSNALKVPIKAQIHDVLPILLNSLAMGVVAYLLTNLPLNIYLQFGVSVCAGITMYYITSLLWFKSTLEDAISMIKRKS